MPNTEKAGIIPDLSALVAVRASTSVVRDRERGSYFLQIFRSRLAGAAVFDNVKADFLAFDQ